MTEQGLVERMVWYPIERLKDRYTQPIWIAAPDLLCADSNPTGCAEAYWQDLEGPLEGEWRTTSFDMHHDEWQTISLRHDQVTHFLLPGSPLFESEQCFPNQASADRIAKLEAERDRLGHVIDRDRYVVATALGEIRKEVNGHRWLLDGRGPYEWDDDRYRDEFSDWVGNVDRATELLAKLAFDKSDCTTVEDKVNAAKLAAREYAQQPSKPGRKVLPSDLGLPCPTCNAHVAKLEAEIEASQARIAVLEGMERGAHERALKAEAEIAKLREAVEAADRVITFAAERLWNSRPDAIGQRPAAIDKDLRTVRTALRTILENTDTREMKDGE